MVVAALMWLGSGCAHEQVAQPPSSEELGVGGSGPSAWDGNPDTASVPEPDAPNPDDAHVEPLREPPPPPVPANGPPPTPNPPNPPPGPERPNPGAGE